MPLEKLFVWLRKDVSFEKSPYKWYDLGECWGLHIVLIQSELEIFLNKEILRKIIAWAEREDSIRIVMLTGSLAGKGPRDEFSDYDIALFTTNIEKYASDDSWIHGIEKVWVYEPWVLRKGDKEYPTRLVVYKDGLQVDYAIFDLDHLNELKQAKTLPVEYNLGYEILLDKDSLTNDLQPATYEYPYAQKPTQEEFDSVLQVFFFEAFKEAKALVREDLWHAKIRDWSIKKRLLKMIEWHEKVKNGWNYDTNCDAKRMRSWVSPEIWTMTHDTFAHFDTADSWEKLVNTLEFFRKLSVEVAEALGLEYPHEMTTNICDHITKLKKTRLK